MKRSLLTVLVAAMILCGCGVKDETKPVTVTAEQPTNIAEENKDEVQDYQEPEKTPKPVEKPEKVNTVSLVVDCTDVLDNMDTLKEEKRGIIPQNGIMYTDSEIEINEGDTVFDVLKRSLISSGVHFEYSMTPVYNSAYIEGIGNLYEFDCGERSGWKYSVNGEVPRVGCSGVKVKPSDKIVFFYKVIGY